MRIDYIKHSDNPIDNYIYLFVHLFYKDIYKGKIQVKKVTKQHCFQKSIYQE